MTRFLSSQLLHRRSRTLTIGVGILVAAVSFVLLTTAVSTSALEVRGTLAKNWKSAYDILVRPPGAATPLELEQGLVADNYLSGIFGGITTSQWRAVLRIPGVEVAAPIANVGYVLLNTRLGVPVSQYFTADPVQIYRVRSEWLAHNGLSTYPGNSTDYVYYTKTNRFIADQQELKEIVPGRQEPLPVCSGVYPQGTRVPRSPFQHGVGLYCYSARSPTLAHLNGWQPGAVPFSGHQLGALEYPQFPILLSAIDPVQESRLVGLNDAMVSGRFLTSHDRARVQHCPDGGIKTVPVIASTETFLGEQLQATVERLHIPAGTDVPGALASRQARHFLRSLPGQRLGQGTSTLGASYQALLAEIAERCVSPPYESYRTVSPVRYGVVGPDRIAALPTRNRDSVWASELFLSYLPAPVENQDVQFRRLTPFPGSNRVTAGVFDTPGLQVVGRFDPNELPGFSALTRVPLETYVPPEVRPGDERADRILGGNPLLPTQNLGDYVAQPPLMLTTIDAARVFFDPTVFHGANLQAPISVIRVRVTGVTGPDPVSRERVRRVAQAIEERTGLTVDITAGSSPHPLQVELPKGTFGRPALTVLEGWTKKGVAFTIVNALDRKSLTLFILVLVVSGLFLANAAFASVRSRRSEIGTLLCLGWGRGVIFRAVLSELALIGLASGLVGTALAFLLVKVMSLEMDPLRAVLVTPVAVTLACLAGLVPAWRAARSIPLDAVRPPVINPRRGRPVRGLARMAAANLLRLPGRSLLGAGALLVGIAALTFLLSVNLAFSGTLVGTLLGAVISVQVRGVDYLSVGLAIALGGLSVADVLFLNLKERAPELVTLRTAGWRDSHLARLIVMEGVGIGLVGAMLGALIGLALGLAVGGPLERLAEATGLAAVAGIAVAGLASLLPALVTGRMAAPAVLAEE
jgi:putative ABC transport system permease protein